MVGYGKKLRELQIQEWKGYVHLIISVKILKIFIYLYQILTLFVLMVVVILAQKREMVV